MNLFTLITVLILIFGFEMANDEMKNYEMENDDIYFKNLNIPFIHKISYEDESASIYALKLEIKGYSNEKGALYYSVDPNNLRQNKILINQEVDFSRKGDWHEPYVYILYEPDVIGNNGGELKLSYAFY